MTKHLSYARFLEFEKAMQVAVSKGRMNEVAARDGLEHVKISTEIGNHDEARVHAERIIESLTDT